MARDTDQTPTLRDAEVDDDMAQDWADIVSRHTVDDGSDTDTTAAPAGERPPASDKSDKGRGADAGAAPAGEDDKGGDRRGDGTFKEGNRYRRRASGKVAAKPAGEGEPPAGTKPAAGETTRAAGETKTPAGETPPAEPQQRDITKPPTTWRPTARAAWASLPEPVRAEIHRREADFMAGQSQLLPDAKYGKDLRDVITPYMQLIEAEGGTPPLAVQDLLRTAAALRGGDVRLKYQTLWNIAQRFGIDLRAFAPRQPPLPPLRDANGNPVPQPAPQPQPQELRDPRLDVLLQSMSTEQTRRAQAEQAQTEQTAGAWLNEVDAQGNPKRPYATDVIDDMSALIPAIKQQNPALTHAQVLDLAYERATWANPEVRALLQQEHTAADEARRRADSQRRADEARRAASVNVRRRGSPPSAGKPGTMAETIESTARELGLLS